MLENPCDAHLPELSLCCNWLASRVTTSCVNLLLGLSLTTLFQIPVPSEIWQLQGWAFSGVAPHLQNAFSREVQMALSWYTFGHWRISSYWILTGLFRFYEANSVFTLTIFMLDLLRVIVDFVNFCRAPWEAFP